MVSHQNIKADRILVVSTWATLKMLYQTYKRTLIDSQAQIYVGTLINTQTEAEKELQHPVLSWFPCHYLLSCSHYYFWHTNNWPQIPYIQASQLWQTLFQMSSSHFLLSFLQLNHCLSTPTLHTHTHPFCHVSLGQTGRQIEEGGKKMTKDGGRKKSPGWISRDLIESVIHYNVSMSKAAGQSFLSWCTNSFHRADWQKAAHLFKRWEITTRWILVVSRSPR